jgi:hypothetical protein
MTTPDAEPPEVPLPELPLVPMVPRVPDDRRRHQEVRRYASRLVDKVGPVVARWIAAEIDEAVQEAESGTW